jgi:hypothetical protein
MKVANKSFENVTNFRYLLIVVTNDYVHEENESRFDLGNAW